MKTLNVDVSVIGAWDCGSRLVSRRRCRGRRTFARGWRLRIDRRRSAHAEQTPDRRRLKPAPRCKDRADSSCASMARLSSTAKPSWHGCLANDENRFVRLWAGRSLRSSTATTSAATPVSGRFRPCRRRTTADRPPFGRAVVATWFFADDPGSAARGGADRLIVTDEYRVGRLALRRRHLRSRCDRPRTGPALAAAGCRRSRVRRSRSTIGLFIDPAIRALRARTFGRSARVDRCRPRTSSAPTGGPRRPLQLPRLGRHESERSR